MFKEIKQTAKTLETAVGWIDSDPAIKTEARKKIVVVDFWNQNWRALYQKCNNNYDKMIINAYYNMVSKKTMDNLSWEESKKFVRKLLRQIQNTERKEWY